VVLFSNKVAQESEKQNLAMEMNTAVSELNIVTYEYLMHHEKRMEQQWHSRYNSAMVILDKAVEKKVEMIELIHASFHHLNDLFSRVTTNHKEKQKLIQEGASQEKIAAAALVEERLVAQLLIESQSIVADTFRFAKDAYIDTVKAQEILRNLTLASMIALALTVITTSLLIAGSISVPLSKLAEYSRRVGQGEYTAEVEIKGKDEVASVASTVETMVGRLLTTQEELKLEIAERRRAEEEIRKLSQFQGSVIDNANVWLDVLDAEANVVVWNRAAEEISGYSREEVVGHGKIWEWLYPDDEYRSEVVADTISIIEEGKAEHSVRTTIRCKDGQTRIISWNSQSLVDKEGNPIGSIALGRDITERVRAEEALRESRSLLRETQKMAKVGGWELDLETNEQVWTEEVYHIHEVDLDYKPDLEGGVSFYAPEHRTIIEQAMQRAAETGEPWDLELQFITAKGNHLWVRAIGKAHLKDGKAIKLSGTFQDITERKRAEEDLRQLNATLEAQVAARTAEITAEKEKSEIILRSAGDAIAMVDREMRIRYVNPAFTTLTGYTAQEIAGQPINSLFGVGMPEQRRPVVQSALESGDAWQGEVPIRRKDGRTYEAAMAIAPIKDTDGSLAGYVSSHQDISRLKDLERARSRFITNVSHELRTPTANIKLYASLLRMAGRPERTGHYAQVLEEQADRLTELIQDILEMTALDSGQGVTVWKPVSLPTIITDAVTHYQSQAQASGLTLVAEPVPPDLPTVKGDQARLSQALGELVENAVIFTPAGGQVTVEARAVEEDWVTVAVRDTGPGISPEEQEQVFDRFYRGSLAESGHVPGTGLGLSIAQEIMRAHGGRVTVESKLGEGSTFTLRLRGAPS